MPGVVTPAVREASSSIQDLRQNLLVLEVSKDGLRCSMQEKNGEQFWKFKMWPLWFARDVRADQRRHATRRPRTAFGWGWPSTRMTRMNTQSQSLPVTRFADVLNRILWHTVCRLTLSILPTCSFSEFNVRFKFASLFRNVQYEVTPTPCSIYYSTVPVWPWCWKNRNRSCPDWWWIQFCFVWWLFASLIVLEIMIPCMLQFRNDKDEAGYGKSHSLF